MSSQLPSPAACTPRASMDAVQVKKKYRCNHRESIPLPIQYIDRAIQFNSLWDNWNCTYELSNNIHSASNVDTRKFDQITISGFDILLTVHLDIFDVESIYGFVMLGGL